jgi:type II secretory pathway component GspD/PulD (secretin)
MRTKLSLILCSSAIFAGVATAQQTGAPSASQSPTIVSTTVAAPDASPGTPGGAVAPAANASPAPEAPAPIEPPASTIPGMAPTPAGAAPDQAAQTGTDVAAPGAAPVAGAATLGSGTAAVSGLNEFQGDDVAQVLRLLARQAKISLVVSDRISDAQPPMKVTMRLENQTPLQTINIIVEDKGLILNQKNGIYFVKTKEEKDAEPTIPKFYTFSYANAEKVLPLLAAQLDSKVAPQFDSRTNTVFYREVGSNMDAIQSFLATVDQPTRQVMIEARLLEVTSNPAQSYGFNWGGVFGSSGSPQTFSYGGTTPGSSTINNQTNPTTGAVNPIVTQSTLPTIQTTGGNFTPQAFLLNAETGVGGLLRAAEGQFAILSIPQMQITMRFLNEDADAELLANPRIVTSDNQQATIKITRNQPVPQLNFNEQTAQAVFGGFTDKSYGNTLVVTPSINKDDFVTLNVKPEISNKVADSVFNFQGATVSSPIIDTRDIESTVLIKSGDTLAIGGLMQDEVTKTHSKVPVLGDIPGIGNAFQEHLNVRTKRNLLIFVTPTIIKQGYGTGLEDQVTGLHHSGEEYADPNGWRNNASGAYRLVPTSHRDLAADYPAPGVPAEPKHLNVLDPDVDYRASAAGASTSSTTTTTTVQSPGN